GRRGLVGGFAYRTLAHDFALEDPHLHANHAVGGVGFGEAVVDVGTQRVQGHATFAVPLGTRDFRAVQTARDVDLDALGAEAHGVRHRALHGAAEHDATLELLGDRFGDQVGVELGLADLLDADMCRHLHERRDLLAQRLDVFTLLANHDTRTRGMDD